MSWSKRIVATIERIPFPAAIFLMLLLQKVSPVLHGGEEQYLTYAKQFVNPNWIPNSFTLTEVAGSRLAFQVIFGWFLQYFSFESFVVIARTLSFALFAVALGNFFKKLVLPKLWTLLFFQLYIMSPQAFFGGEWIFAGFEPKTVAYIFVFFSLPFLQDEKAIPAALLLALGTYFHFLVTGWIVLIVVLWWLLSGQVKLALQFVFVFGLATLPFVGYLYFSVLKDSKHIIEGVNVDWYYSYFRLRHHLGIASSWEYFVQHQLPGIIVAIAVATLVFKFKKVLPSRFSLLTNFSVLAVSVATFFVVVALVDSFLLHQEATFFLKTYPFRSMALAMFFSFLLSGFWLNSMLTFTWVSPTVAIVLMGLFVAQVNNNFNRQRIYADENKDFNSSMDYIRSNTLRSAVFLTNNLKSSQEEQFVRKAEREAMYVFKFTPAVAEKIYEWVSRMQIIGEVKSGKTAIGKLKQKYNLTHVISEGPSDILGLEQIHQEGNVYLYKVN